MSTSLTAGTKTTAVTAILRASVLATVALTSNAAAAAAHHSFAAEFDLEKPVTLKGAVVLWEIINPHGWITIDVRGPRTGKPSGGWSKPPTPTASCDSGRPSAR